MSLELLPSDVLFEQLKFLPYPDIVNLCKSNKSFRSFCHIDLVKKFIIKRGLDYHYDQLNITPSKTGKKNKDWYLRTAGLRGYYDVVIDLLNKEQYDDEEIFNALLGAIQNNKFETVQILLKVVEDPIRLDNLLLESSAKNQNLEILKLLLKDARFTANSINSLLFFAIQYNNMELAEIIINDKRGNPCFYDDRIRNIRDYHDNEVIRFLNDNCYKKSYLGRTINKFRTLW